MPLIYFPLKKDSTIGIPVIKCTVDIPETEGRVVCFKIDQKQISKNDCIQNHVKLFNYKRKWYLFYPEKDHVCTGSFKRKCDAVKWFNSGGR